ncbi:Endoplasmic reticulum vesicle transporter, C-terminal [Phytophthora cactorum]|nr:Endoplasmic reticulum vesicle transporter, C-terminal [Phytophthora cactorum]
MSWRRFDLNVKGVEGIQERTIGGGVVTVVSCVVVAFLLLSEFSVWWTVSVTHRMHVDTDPQQDFPINIEVDVSFLHEACTEVAMDVSDSKGHKEIMLKKDIQEEPFGENGCRLYGSVQVQKVAGDLSFAHEGSLTIPDMETPLIDVSKILTKNLATYKYFVSVVPSRYVYLNGRSVTTFQYSVTEHETSSRGPKANPSVLHFLTSTSAIVGGVFAVARMIDGAIYSVSKKVD